MVGSARVGSTAFGGVHAKCVADVLWPGSSTLGMAGQWAPRRVRAAPGQKGEGAGPRVGRRPGGPAGRAGGAGRRGCLLAEVRVPAEPLGPAHVRPGKSIAALKMETRSLAFRGAFCQSKLSASSGSK